MVKKYIALPMGLLSAMLISLPVYAGGINGAEQSIISAISGTYEYNGGYYRVTDGYISQVVDRLSQDGMDLTTEQANNYLAQFYGNIGTGVSAGYMAKVGDVAPPAPEQGSQGGNTETNSGSQGGSTETNPGTQGGNAETGQGTQNGSTEAGQGTTAETAGSEQSSQVESPEVVQGSSQTESSAAGEDTTMEEMDTRTEEADTTTEENAETTEAYSNTDNTAGSNQDGALSYSVAPVDAIMYVWEIEELTVHKEAYKDSEIIGTLTAGDEVKVTGAATTGWAQIDYNGEVGYCSAIHLRTDGFVEEKTKDYSNQEPIQQGIGIEVLAGVIVVLVLVASTVVVLWHKTKKRK